MASQIFFNGPPAWVLEERRRQAAEQSAPTSEETLSKVEVDTEGVPASESTGAVPHPRTSSTQILESVRQAQKRASTAS